MELTRDRHDIVGAENVINGRSVEGPIDRPLRILGTGKGVRIGDTPAKLIERIGKPSKIARSGERKQYIDYDYVFKAKVEKREPVVFTETYTFKRGVLIQIIFDRSLEGT